MTNTINNRGLLKLVQGAYHGGLGLWLSIANILTLVATGLFIWCGYQFFVVETSEELIFWGFCTVTAIMVQIALKQWVWLEISRTSLISEIDGLKQIILERT